MRPYRLGLADEPVEGLFDRITREVERQRRDAEEVEGDDPRSGPEFDALLAEGLAILRRSADEKWDVLRSRVLAPAGDEKVVLFAQPIETVTALADYLERTTGERPALILGGQDDAERRGEVERFCRPDGPHYLVSSRAGGEGINLQVARRLVHLDVPWNPMEMEQRVGRVHRFGSRRTILMDTLVVKDSREADAYRVARDRLALIAGVMTDPERFESLFARAMSLVSPTELLGVLANAPLAPLGFDDQEQLAALVRSGFEAWSAFHERFAQQQRQIRRQDPGLATWADVDGFLRQFAGARPAEGFRAHRFMADGDEVRPIEESVGVLVLGDGRPYACGEESGAPVVGPDGATARSLGLNLAPVVESLRRHGLGPGSGAAHLRWPSGVPAPMDLPFGVLAFVRQTLQSRSSSWAEHGCTLCVYLVGPADEPVLLHGEPKASLLRGLFAASIRSRPTPNTRLVERLRRLEATLAERLRPPDDRERELGLRHAASPLFAAIVEAGR